MLNKQWKNITEGEFREDTSVRFFNASKRRLRSFIFSYFFKILATNRNVLASALGEFKISLSISELLLIGSFE